MSHRIVVLPRVVGEDRAHGLLRGRSGQQTARLQQWRLADYFPSAASRLYIARQNSRPAAILRFALAASASLRGAGPVRPPPFVAMKAAMGAVDPTKGSTP